MTCSLELAGGGSWGEGGKEKVSCTSGVWDCWEYCKDNSRESHKPFGYCDSDGRGDTRQKQCSFYKVVETELSRSLILQNNDLSVGDF